jgi:hypothetical protein
MPVGDTQCCSSVLDVLTESVCQCHLASFGGMSFWIVADTAKYATFLAVCDVTD